MPGYAYAERISSFYQELATYCNGKQDDFEGAGKYRAHELAAKRLQAAAQVQGMNGSAAMYSQAANLEKAFQETSPTKIDPEVIKDFMKTGNGMQYQDVLQTLGGADKALSLEPSDVKNAMEGMEKEAEEVSKDVNPALIQTGMDR